jgi:hypothetical protein
MAKALFQKSQRVWVESVGAWAIIERLVPIWAKGFGEPVRVNYDLGLGRDFQGHELRAELDADEPLGDNQPKWRLLRAHNKWQDLEACSHHPFPGSYPVVVTDSNDWGGWRTPGAEYDRDPYKIEFQARLIAQAPQLLDIARRLADMVEESPGSPPELQELAEISRKIDKYLRDIPTAPEGAPPATSEADAA